MSARDYVDYIFLERIYPNGFDTSWSNKWLADSVIRDAFVKALHLAFKTFGVEIDNRWDFVAIEHFDRMVESGVIEVDSDPFAGRFFRINGPGKDTYVQAHHSQNDVAERVKRIGDVVLNRAIPIIGSTDDLIDDQRGAVATQLAAEAVLSDQGINIPASDRIVSFDDNLRGEFDDSIEEVCELVRGDNNETDSRFKDRVLGQIRAGRELLRAGTFKAYLLYQTLLSALGELISRYGEATIGIAATALLQALIEKGIAG